MVAIYQFFYVQQALLGLITSLHLNLASLTHYLHSEASASPTWSTAFFSLQLHGKHELKAAVITTSSAGNECFTCIILVNAVLLDDVEPHDNLRLTYLPDKDHSCVKSYCR